MSLPIYLHGMGSPILAFCDDHQSSIVNVSSYLKLVSGRALLPRPPDVLQCDTRMLAHRPENPVLRIKSFGRVEFRDVAVVHHTDSIVRHYRAQAVYGSYSRRQGNPPPNQRVQNAEGTYGRCIRSYDHGIQWRWYLGFCDPSRSQQRQWPRLISGFCCL